MPARKTTANKSAEKRPRAKRVGAVPPAPDPFREQIVIARGENVDGHAHMTAAAHRGIGAVDTGPDRRTEAERVQHAISASDSTPAAGTNAADFTDPGKEI